MKNLYKYDSLFLGVAHIHRLYLRNIWKIVFFTPNTICVDIV